MYSRRYYKAIERHTYHFKEKQENVPQINKLLELILNLWSQYLFFLHVKYKQ